MFSNVVIHSRYYNISIYWRRKLFNKLYESVVLIVDTLKYAEALLLINKQHRNGEIDTETSVKLHKFCKELHLIWKEKKTK